MQVGRMHRVDVALVPLQVIAVGMPAVRKPELLGRIDRRVRGKQRRFARPHVGPDRPATFNTGIGNLPDAIAMRAALRFAGLLQAGARRIEEPAVIHAAQTAVFNAAIAQIRLPVRATQCEETHAAVAAAKQHQILAHDLERQRRATFEHVRRQGHRLPVTAK